jgi:hypothetical protein
MAFVNEIISEKDKVKLSTILTFEKIRAQAKYVPEFTMPEFWAIDRNRGVYVLFLTGGGREQLPYYVLGMEGLCVIFNVKNMSNGNYSMGIYGCYEVHDLRIPPALEPRRDEIKQLIREGLEEDENFRPTADGGTWQNPNMTARANYLSFKVEFK